MPGSRPHWRLPQADWHVGVGVTHTPKRQSRPLGQVPQDSVEPSAPQTRIEQSPKRPQTSHSPHVPRPSHCWRPRNPSAQIEHEATTSKISDDQMFYAMQRGLNAEEAVALIVNGFAKEVLQQLPMEFAVEAQKLLGISLEGSVG